MTRVSFSLRWKSREDNGLRVQDPISVQRVRDSLLNECKVSFLLTREKKVSPSPVYKGMDIFETLIIKVSRWGTLQWRNIYVHIGKPRIIMRHVTTDENNNS